MLQDVISHNQLQEHVQQLGEKYDIYGLETQIFRDEMRNSTVLKIVKRIDDVKVGTEIGIGDRQIMQAKQGQFDIIANQIERAVRKFDSGLGESYPMYHREIFCRIHDEHVVGRCEQCGYETALGNFPLVRQNDRDLIAVEKWKRIVVAMYLCEKVHRECHCGSWTDSENFFTSSPNRNL